MPKKRTATRRKKMFLFGKSKGAKKAAKELLSQAEKVYNYRRDIMPKDEAEKFYALLDKLDDLVLDAKTDSAEFDRASKDLEAAMKKYGGMVYPLSTVSDYVDTIIVAGILAIAVRSFFLQPFKIPTNSMYPSFYGMTSKVYERGESGPDALERAWRTIRLGAGNYKVEAPKDGEALLEINSLEAAHRYGGMFAFKPKRVNKYFVWPSVEREYTFNVGGKDVKVSVPADFNLDSVIMQAYPVGDAGSRGVRAGRDVLEYISAARNAGRVVNLNGTEFLRLGEFKRGEPVINFDILGGDMLFVDRFTYNFRKPKVGEPIVFMTKYCEGMTRRNGGVPDDKYYIKRLAGQEGDQLQIRQSTLYRNGKPAEGSYAFGKNASKEGDYCGYVADGALSDGASIKISPKHYYALGDNSENSLDSRYWGEVPEKAVVGKSLIIFYPFTNRWGATK